MEEEFYLTMFHVSLSVIHLPTRDMNSHYLVSFSLILLYAPRATKTVLGGFSSVQPLSRVQLFAIPWITACQASRSITNSRSSPKPMSIESRMPSNHLILCHSLLLLLSIFPSIRVFSNKSVLCMRWPKYWSFSLDISPSDKHSGLISFRIDWFDLLAVQGTLKSLFQHLSSKHQFLSTQPSLWSNSHIHTWLLLLLLLSRFSHVQLCATP